MVLIHLTILVLLGNRRSERLMEVGDILPATFIEDLPSESVVGFLVQLYLKVFLFSIQPISFSFYK